MQLLTIFPMLQYDFMRHAFLAAVLIAPLFALLGTMAVNNKMAFFSDALGHSAFTGIGLGVLLGMQEPLLAMLAFGIFLGLVNYKVNPQIWFPRIRSSVYFPRRQWRWGL